MEFIRFPCLWPNVLFLSQYPIQYTTLNLVIPCYAFLGSSLLWQFFRFLVSEDLDNWEFCMLAFTLDPKLLLVLSWKVFITFFFQGTSNQVSTICVVDFPMAIVELASQLCHRGGTHVPLWSPENQDHLYLWGIHGSSRSIL